jgi:hypothetical protein
MNQQWISVNLPNTTELKYSLTPLSKLSAIVLYQLIYKGSVKNESVNQYESQFKKESTIKRGKILLGGNLFPYIHFRTMGYYIRKLLSN